MQKKIPSFQKENLEKNLAHPACFLISPEYFIEEILDSVSLVLDIKKNSPDFLFLDAKTFGIDDSRLLKSFLSTMPTGPNRKVAVISVDDFSYDAQNALLKSVEDAHMNTSIIFIKKDLSKILPTLLSRVSVLDIRDDEKTNDAPLFLKMDQVERLERISSLVKKQKDEKDKTEIIQMLDEIEIFLASQEKRDFRDLEYVLKTKEAVRDTGASVKMILEGLALSLPVF